ncbi:MAG: helix-turn-helix transcriptional regulator [Clostridia bacterium]|nr:helix-turn-helix transcriptional regulator [Clostridia bacterium]MBQ4459127.1 helix-turn-helix transcriptional regulator [Clostridia bacterium]MBQ6785831.1 helix-turn-helix transcriptional regulator [Clostridia bacterium]
MMEYAKQSRRSMAEISEKMGHRNNYISGVGNGRFEPKLEEVLYFCELLDIAPSDFFREQELTLDQQELCALVRKAKPSHVKLLIAILKELQNPFRN